MNKIIAIFLLSILVTIPHYSYSRKKSSSQINVFFQTHKQIQELLNKLFLLLKLNKNFTRVQKNRALLAMHTNMKIIAENNYEIYRNLKELCKLESTKKRQSKMFNLDQLIEVLVEERVITINEYPANQTNELGLNMMQMNIPDNSETSISFLKEYLDKIEDVDLIRLFSRRKMKKDIQIIEKRSKLKIWHPPDETDLILLSNTRRLFYGERAVIQDFPFMASLHVLGEFVGAGSIISRDKVITAATCLQEIYNIGNDQFFEDHPSGLQVRLGSDYTMQGGEVRVGIDVFFHPDFDPVSFRHNLAIIQMKEQKKNTKLSKKIRKVPYKAQRNATNYKDVMVLGWGEKEYDKVNNSTRLSFSKLDIVDIKHCTDVYSQTYVVNETNFCAGFVSKGSGACHRDVGGPGLVKNMLAGVMSFGPPVCGTKGAPTVFNKLEQYSAWIDNIVAMRRANKTKEQPIPSTPSTNQRHKTNRSIISSAQIRRLLRDPQIRTQLLKNVAEFSKSRKFSSQEVWPKAVGVLTSLFGHLASGMPGNNDDQEDDENGENNIDIMDLLFSKSMIATTEKIKIKGNGFADLAKEKMYAGADRGEENPVVQGLQSLTNYLGVNGFLNLPSLMKMSPPSEKSKTKIIPKYQLVKRTTPENSFSSEKSYEKEKKTTKTQNTNSESSSENHSNKQTHSALLFTTTKSTKPDSESKKDKERHSSSVSCEGSPETADTEHFSDKEKNHKTKESYLELPYSNLGLKKDDEHQNSKENSFEKSNSVFDSEESSKPGSHSKESLKQNVLSGWHSLSKSNSAPASKEDNTKRISPVLHSNEAPLHTPDSVMNNKEKSVYLGLDFHSNEVPQQNNLVLPRIDLIMPTDLALSSTPSQKLNSFSKEDSPERTKGSSVYSEEEQVSENKYKISASIEVPFPRINSPTKTFTNGLVELMRDRKLNNKYQQNSQFREFDYELSKIKQKPPLQKKEQDKVNAHKNIMALLNKNFRKADKVLPKKNQSEGWLEKNAGKHNISQTDIVGITTSTQIQVRG